MTTKPKKIAVLTRKVFRVHEFGAGGETEKIEVRVMATAEGYAMVRRKGCAPFVCDEKQLSYNASSAPKWRITPGITGLRRQHYDRPKIQAGALPDHKQDD